MFAAPRRGSTGFTLIEVLIAMFIFMLGILGVMSMFPVAMRTASIAMGEMRGNTLGRSALAQLSSDCSVPYETGQAAASTSNTVVRPAPPAPVTDARAGYYVTLTGGPGAGQSRLITADDLTTITVNRDWSAMPAWSAPEAGDSYIITRMGLPDPPLPAPPPPPPGEPHRYREFGLNRDLIIRQIEQPNVLYAGVPDGPLGSATVNPLLGDKGTAADPVAPHDDDDTHLDVSGTPWTADDYVNHYVRLTDGRGVGQVRLITANTSNQLTISPPWDTTDIPDHTTTYEIGWTENQTWVDDTTTGTATAGAVSTLTDAAASWTPGAFVGATVILTGGTGSGQTRYISENTDTVLTVFTGFVTAPAAGTTYGIVSRYGYVLITSGKSTGRVFPIIDDVQDANGHKITCLGADWDKYGITPAMRGIPPSASYKRAGATTFTVIGNSTPGLLNALPRAEPNSSPPLITVNRLNILGAEDRTAADTFGSSTSEGSTYSYVAIFSDNGILAGNPVRADVFVFRNLDPAKPLGQNRKPVGFLTGYIRRP